MPPFFIYSPLIRNTLLKPLTSRKAFQLTIRRAPSTRCHPRIEKTYTPCLWNLYPLSICHFLLNLQTFQQQLQRVHQKEGSLTFTPRSNSKNDVAWPLFITQLWILLWKVLTHCTKGEPKLNVSKAFSIKFQSKLSKAFLKSKNNAIPGLYSVFVCSIMSAIKRMFWPIKRPLIYPLILMYKAG